MFQREFPGLTTGFIACDPNSGEPAPKFGDGAVYGIGVRVTNKTQESRLRARFGANPFIYIGVWFSCRQTSEIEIDL